MILLFSRNIYKFLLPLFINNLQSLNTVKILHISGAKSWGGNEQQLIITIPEIKKHNFDSYIFGVPNSPLHNVCIKKGFHFICCKSNKLNKPINYKFLKETIIELKPDLLHLHTSDSVTLFVVSDLLYKLRIPTVFSKKGVSRNVSFLSKLKYNYKNIDKVLCVSETVKTHFNDILKVKNQSKLCVVYDGVSDKSHLKENVINLRKEHNLDGSVRIIGNIANHTKAKDLKTLIETVNVLINIKKMSNLHVFQIGSFSKLTNELKDLVEEYQLRNYFTFLGFIENASSVLPQFDVFLMTSEREGGPTSVLEAFQNKVAVVSTKVGVVSDMVINGVNGFSAEISNFEELANDVVLILNDDSLKNNIIKEANQLYLDNFTVEKLGSYTSKIYNTVLKK